MNTATPMTRSNDLDHCDLAESVMLSLAQAIEARDQQTAGHCQRLASYAVVLGDALHLSPSDLATLRRGGFLHDIGKVGVPDAILLKPGPLTAAERARMNDHTTIGDRLCAGLPSLSRVRQIVRSHHERIDGSGYPDGLTNPDIPLLAQIISIVDAFDALTTVRPYKPALPVEQAYQELRDDAARGWKRWDLVEAFIALGRDGRITREVA